MQANQKELFASMQSKQSRGKEVPLSRQQVLNLLHVFMDQMERNQTDAVEQVGRRYGRLQFGNLQSCLETFSASGLGRLELVELIAGNQEAIFQGWDLLQGSSFSSTQGVDDFTRGFLAGMVSRICDLEVNCEEIECVAKGDPCCRFVVNPVFQENRQSLRKLTTVALDIGYVGGLECLAPVVAEELLFTPNLGIELNLHPHKYRQDLYQALLTEEVNGAFLPIPAVLAAFQQGKPLKLVCLTNRNSCGLIVTDSLVASLEAKEVPKKPFLLAVSNKLCTSYLLLHKWMQQNDTSFQVVSIAENQLLYNLEQKEIDGFFSGEPYVTQAELGGLGKALVTSQDIWPRHPDCAFVVTQEIYQQYPEVVREVGKQIEVAGSIIETDRLWTAKFAAQQFRLTEAVTEACLLHNPLRLLYANLKIKPEEIQAFLDVLEETGQITQPLNLEALFMD